MPEKRNKGISEKQFVSDILVLLSKERYPLEHFTLIPLGGIYAGEFTPALINYSGDCVFVADNKAYKSRGTALKRLGDLWSIAERMQGIFSTDDFLKASQGDFESAWESAFTEAKSKK